LAAEVQRGRKLIWAATAAKEVAADPSCGDVSSASTGRIEAVIIANYKAALVPKP
jgi:hypothetical protein